MNDSQVSIGVGLDCVLCSCVHDDEAGWVWLGIGAGQMVTFNWGLGRFWVKLGSIRRKFSRFEGYALTPTRLQPPKCRLHTYCSPAKLLRLCPQAMY